MALPNTTPDSNVLPEVVVTGTSRSSSSDFLKGRMNLFDTRLYRKLTLFNETQSQEGEQIFYPHFDYGSYVTDYYESPTSIQQTLEETSEGDPAKKALEARKKYVEDFNKTNQNQ